MKLTAHVLSVAAKLISGASVRWLNCDPENYQRIYFANHTSHLDALVLGATLPLKLRDQLFPLATGDVFFHTPALAAFSATVLNALPVWRKKVGGNYIRST